jgi:rhodanese-related sulfurtransferase
MSDERKIARQLVTHHSLLITYHLLLNFDFDAAALLLYALGQAQAQHAVLVLGRDPFLIDVRRDAEPSQEAAARAFGAPLMLFIDCPQTANRQAIIVEVDLEGRTIYARQVERDDELAFMLVHVGGRRPIKALYLLLALVGAGAPVAGLLEESIHTFLQSHQITHRAPML